MSKSKITEEHSNKIEALAGSGEFTYQDIANAFNNEFTINQIQYHINKYHKDLKSKIKKEYSRGGTKLEALLKEIFPYNKIKPEFQIGQRLRVDFLVEAPYNIAFEFDGSQHSKYCSHFHRDRSGFRLSEERDALKEKILAQRGVSLVRISQLDIDDKLLRKMIDQAGYGSGVISDDALTSKERKHKLKQEQQLIKNQKQAEYLKKVKKKKSSFNSSFAEEMKERQRLIRKEQYQRQKEWIKKNKK